MAKSIHFDGMLDSRDVTVDGFAHKGELRTWNYPGSDSHFEITKVVDDKTGEEVDVDILSSQDIDSLQERAWYVLRMQEREDLSGA